LGFVAAITLRSLEMKKNGVAKQVESVVDAVMEELRARSGDTGKAAGEAARGAGESVAEGVRDADVGEKVERMIDFIEENASVLGQVGKRLAADMAREAPVAAAAVGEAAGQAAETAGAAVGSAAESAGEAVSDVIETIGEEIVQPTVRYGRGLRHGLLIGAGIAILYTPWPGAVVREKLKGFAREAMDLVDAIRAGAADA
jgi:cobalamin biosynthesis Mg chelatase CobN